MSGRAEVVALGYELFNRGDWESTLDGLHEDVEWVDHPDLLEADTHRGREAVREFWRRFFEAWESARMDPEEIVEQGDVVRVRVHFTGHGRVSGLETDFRYDAFWTFRGGLIARVENRPGEDDPRPTAGR